VERLAVLPLENLTPHPSLNWSGTALARVLAEELSASTRILPFSAENMAVARLSNASRAVQGYYTSDGGRLVFHAVVRNLETNRNEKWLQSSPGGDPILGAATEFAKQIDARTRAFGTQNSTALRAWGESLQAGDPNERAELLEKAITADPGFGGAYTALTQTYISAGDQIRALDAAKRARERLSSFTDLDRARMELVNATLTNNAEERRTALVALSRLISTDPQTARTLADAELAARRFGTAVEMYRNAAALEPENTGLLNVLGYAEAYNGNLEAARSVLERYRALDPKGINPLDSLGEVHFYLGKFAEAEKYFLEAEKLQPGAATAVQVLKAAQARYLAGDTSGADTLEARAQRAAQSSGNLLSEFRHTQWLYITSRRDQAISAAEVAAKGQHPEAAPLSVLQLAVWKLDAGDRERAKALAAAAASSSRNPGIQRLAAIIQSMAGDAVTGLDPSSASAAQAYAALFAKDFAKAAESFKALLVKSSPAVDGELRTMLALALNETGRKDEARALLSRYFIPIGSSEDALLATHAFPHFLELRRALVGSK
jgi:tetratricopeptide (TPR) repeat protein